MSKLILFVSLVFLLVLIPYHRVYSQEIKKDTNKAAKKSGPWAYIYEQDKSYEYMLTTNVVREADYPGSHKHTVTYDIKAHINLQVTAVKKKGISFLLSFKDFNMSVRGHFTKEKSKKSKIIDQTIEMSDPATQEIISKIFLHSTGGIELKDKNIASSLKKIFSKKMKKYIKITKQFKPIFAYVVTHDFWERYLNAHQVDNSNTDKSNKKIIDELEVFEDPKKTVFPKSMFPEKLYDIATSRMGYFYKGIYKSSTGKRRGRVSGQVVTMGSGRGGRTKDNILTSGHYGLKLSYEDKAKSIKDSLSIKSNLDEISQYEKSVERRLRRERINAVDPTLLEAASKILIRLYGDSRGGPKQYTPMRLRGMTSLILTETMVSDVDLKELSNLPFLTHVGLGYYHKKNKDKFILTPDFLKFLWKDRIESLNLNMGFTNKYLGTINQFVKLNTLRVYWWSEELDYNLIKDLPIKNLNLSGPQIKGKNITVLKEIEELEELRISSSGIDSKILVFLKDLKNLNKLRLSSCSRVTDEVMDSIATLEKLNSLILSSCSNVGDEGLKKIITLKNIEHLGLYECNKMTPAVLPHLLQLKNLKSLSLGKWILTDEHLSVLKQFTNLESLSIDKDSGISIEGFEELRMALPNCRIR